MNKYLLSLPAIAGLVVAASAVSAQATPASGIGLHVDASMVQKAHGDRWDNDRPWWRRDRDWDDRGSWNRKWWWHRHRGDRERHGDRDWDRDRGDHRRGDWR
jgi:hypothetical protein